jgi:carbon monoxide dehydrogenase subunit G
MKINGSYTLRSIGQERAFAILQNPDILAKCIPGCESLEKSGDGEYIMKMAFAALPGQFTGKVKLTDPLPPSSYRMIVEGAARFGSMKGEGLLRLESAEQGVEVTFDGDVEAGGTMAALGQRLIEATSKMMIKRFFDNLNEELRVPA